VIQRLTLVMLLIASPAWGAGNVREAKCDNPGSDVTCNCSEPLTVDDGTVTVAHNPSGSTGSTECLDGFNPVAGGATLTWVDPSNLPAGAGITVGGDGKVMKSAAGGNTNINDNQTTFTDGTFCERHYEYRTPAYDCGGPTTQAECNVSPLVPDCNFKNSRFEKPDPGNHPGLESFTQRCTATPLWEIGIRYQGGTFGECVNSNASGCMSSSRMRRTNPDSLTWEQQQTGWLRWEICIDHNLSSTQVNTLNSAYPASHTLTYPGPDHMYVRHRLTMITGPHAGKETFLGPSYASISQPTIHTGSVTRHFANIHGNPVSGSPQPVRGDTYVSYVMATVKATADPLYWIGAAQEIEGAPPVVPPPTETEGVNFGSGVNLSSILPWFGDGLLATALGF